MSVIQPSSLLDPVSPERPCGENLEDTNEFMEVERAIEVRSEPAIAGAIVEPTDWEDISDKTIDLFGRTKDLRLALVLVRAQLELHGLRGFHAALSVLHGLIDRYWDGVHPEMDPTDDEATRTLYRTNILSGLVAYETIVTALRHAPLVAAPGYRPFSLRDVEVAEGKSPLPEGAEAPNPQEIHAAFMDADLETLKESAAAGAESLALLDDLDARLDGVNAPLNSQHFQQLKDAVREGVAILQDRLGRRGVSSTPVPEAGGAPMDAGAAQDAAAPAAQAVGGISSREDIIRQLDLMCDYLERNEPSSPVPLLLQRAKRLVSKSFLEIIRDMAPEGMNQARLISGLDSDN